MSFQTVYSYFAKMAHYRNAAEIPLILVGTQGLLSKREIPGDYILMDRADITTQNQ
jgi:hypothetical protein